MNTRNDRAATCYGYKYENAVEAAREARLDREERICLACGHDDCNTCPVWK